MDPDQRPTKSYTEVTADPVLQSTWQWCCNRVLATISSRRTQKVPTGSNVTNNLGNYCFLGIKNNKWLISGVRARAPRLVRRSGCWLSSLSLPTTSDCDDAIAYHSCLAWPQSCWGHGIRFANVLQRCWRIVVTQPEWDLRIEKTLESIDYIWRWGRHVYFRRYRLVKL